MVVVFCLLLVSSTCVAAAASGTDADLALLFADSLLDLTDEVEEFVDEDDEEESGRRQTFASDVLLEVDSDKMDENTDLVDLVEEDRDVESCCCCFSSSLVGCFSGDCALIGLIVAGFSWLSFILQMGAWRLTTWTGSAHLRT